MVASLGIVYSVTIVIEKWRQVFRVSILNIAHSRPGNEIWRCSVPLRKLEGSIAIRIIEAVMIVQMILHLKVQNNPKTIERIRTVGGRLVTAIFFEGTGAEEAAILTKSLTREAECVIFIDTSKPETCSVNGVIVRRQRHLITRQSI